MSILLRNVPGTLALHGATVVQSSKARNERGNEMSTITFDELAAKYADVNEIARELVALCAEYDAYAVELNAQIDSSRIDLAEARSEIIRLNNVISRVRWFPQQAIMDFEAARDDSAAALVEYSHETD